MPFDALHLVFIDPEPNYTANPCRPTYQSNPTVLRCLSVTSKVLGQHMRGKGSRSDVTVLGGLRKNGRAYPQCSAAVFSEVDVL